MSYDSYQVPIAESSLGAYFKGRLEHHAQQLKPQPHDDTCWYLGSLLERFSRSEQFLTWQDGQLSLRPLALLYGDALQAGNERERCMLLQHLGDMALFLGALFPRMYERYGICRDYFIGMGGGAYDYLAENARHQRHIFAELARFFARMLEMVARVCSRDEPVSNEDILALYQRWHQSGDPVAESQLRALGIALSDSERLQ